MSSECNFSFQILCYTKSIENQFDEIKQRINAKDYLTTSDFEEIKRLTERPSDPSKIFAYLEELTALCFTKAELFNTKPFDMPKMPTTAFTMCLQHDNGTTEAIETFQKMSNLRNGFFQQHCKNINPQKALVTAQHVPVTENKSVEKPVFLPEEALRIADTKGLGRQTYLKNILDSYIENNQPDYALQILDTLVMFPASNDYLKKIMDMYLSNQQPEKANLALQNRTGLIFWRSEYLQKIQAALKNSSLS